MALIVSWTIGTRPNSDLVNTMLDAAIETVENRVDRPVVHSDHGAHYRWPARLSRMHKAKLTHLMARKGCSPDNAALKDFFGRLKTELFYSRNWQDSTIEQFMQVVDLISADITKSVSKSPWAHLVSSNTVRALDLLHKPVQVLRSTPFDTTA